MRRGISIVLIVLGIISIWLHPYISSYYDVNPTLKFSPNLKQSLKNKVLGRHIENIKDSKNYRIVMNVHQGLGDSKFAYRVMSAADSLGWDVAVVLDQNTNSYIIPKLNPDFILSVNTAMPPIKGFKNYLYVYFVTDRYVDGNGRIVERFANMKRYDAFLSSLENIDFLEKAITAEHRRFYSIPAYPSSPGREFKALSYNKLFYCGENWDKVRGTDYLEMYRLLDGTDYFNVYGPASAWKGFRSYGGFISFEDSLINKIQKSGIALVLHSGGHIKYGIPTARIFESAAASAIVISDKHPFVMKHFGDSVLYIDQTLGPREMFRQIDAHVKWIKANPKKAAEKARRAHEIFAKNFTLEQELLKIAAMHERIKVEATGIS